MSVIKGFYAILNLPHSRPYMDLVRSFYEGGGKLLQLRMKGFEKNEIIDVAKEVASFRKEHPFTFIINDHADIATEVGADGVHVGKGDEDPCCIRERYGTDLIIGMSTHSLEEVRAALLLDLDYIAFGAIFKSPSKGFDHPVQGLDRLSEAVRISGGVLPLVAIGGINRFNIDDVLARGVRCVAMISAWSGVDDVRSEVAWWTRKLGRWY